MSDKNGYVGIVVSGGPAPGINCVISSAVIEANNRGLRVKGLRHGFRQISTGGPDALEEITTDRVSRIADSGGSILGTARFNPFAKPDTRETFLRALHEASINKLIVIGGEGSAYLSYQVSQNCPSLQVVHIPKTIDNDLILPNEYPSFGFETARHAGSKIIKTLTEDSKTCETWFMVTTMGRRAGFLALGLGLAAGTTMTLIPEEFRPGTLKLDDLAQMFFDCIKRRASMGKPYGVMVMAEGLLDALNPDSDPVLQNWPKDDLGRLRYSHMELHEVLAPLVRKKCAAANLPVRLYTKNIGYELRCHAPISFDIEYTRFLGYGAVTHLLSGKSGTMVTRDFDRLGAQPLSDIMLPDGTVKSRRVDLNSDLYRVARSYMFR